MLDRGQAVLSLLCVKQRFSWLINYFQLLATILSSSWQERETVANVEEQCELLIKSKIQLEASIKALSARVEEEEEILMLPGHRQKNVQKMPHMEVSWG